MTPKIGYTKPFRSGLGLLFPALGLIEAQLLNFPTLLADFLQQLKKIFPQSTIYSLTSERFYNQFITAISTNSPNGSIVDWNELDVSLG
uniref:Uncharacterized protein n=1 Tax=Meloidogyne javanica TaxID=6303 RepID=A0A915LWA0_MELJA